MDAFAYRGGELFCEEVPVGGIARHVGTPVYVYSRRTIEDHYRKLERAFGGIEALLTYSVKANSNLAVLKVLGNLGAGFDIVSGGELHRVLAAGGEAGRTVFAGVGKTDAEIQEALAAGVGLFTVESEEELSVLSDLAAARGLRAAAALRVNPDVDPATHRFITTGKRENKFGVDFCRARAVFMRPPEDWPGVDLCGIHAHIGSQITSSEPYRLALERIVGFLEGLPAPVRARVKVLDCGGGFGAHYRGEEAIPAEVFAGAILPAVRRAGCRLVLELGRFVVANAGILLTRVQFVKEGGDRKFVICDAGMHTLIRPPLYGGFHRIWPVATPMDSGRVDWSRKEWGEAPPGLELVDVVGPICESADFLAQGRPLPPVRRGDLLSVFTAGAYGFVMASRYNSHPLPAEVLVEGDRFRVVRQPETYADLLKGETV